MQTEIVYIMGFWGWLGWVVAVAVSALYVHLWRSSGAKNLRLLNRRLSEASSCIATLQEENFKLQNRNDYLRTELNKLQTSYTDMRNKLALLAKANETLRGIVHSQSQEMKDLSAQTTSYFKRLEALERQGNNGSAPVASAEPDTTPPTA